MKFKKLRRFIFIDMAIPDILPKVNRIFVLTGMELCLYLLPHQPAVVASHLAHRLTVANPAPNDKANCSSASPV